MPNAAYFVVILSLFVINQLRFTISEPSDCHLISACKCEFENGTGIDLSGLRETMIVLSNSTKRTLVFHPCSNTKEIPDSLVSNVTLINDCKISGYSVCEFEWYENPGKFILRGQAKDAVFKLSSFQNYLIYKRNINEMTITIQLACTNVMDSYLYSPNNLNPIENETNLLLFSPHACLYQMDAPHHLSAGSTLVIVFLIVVSIYLGLGILFKIFITGASGIEILPNIEFWQDLPALVRDGAKFVQNGCKVDPLMQNNQDSYDAI